MGTKKNTKLLVLLCLLCITSLLVYSSNTSSVLTPEMPLKELITDLDGYTLIRETSLLSEQITMLNLDEYFFADYNGPTGTINLYVGQYFSAGKAYAAHSPLICYPSQGWKIDSKPKHLSLTIGPNTINYMEITTSFDNRKELVLYWYQAGLFTNTQIYKNKIDMGYNKLMNNNEQHGFVRVAIPFKTTYEESQLVAKNFIEAFYPHFIDYVSNSSSNVSSTEDL